jgi:hypothetical protein
MSRSLRGQHHCSFSWNALVQVLLICVLLLPGCGKKNKRAADLSEMESDSFEMNYENEDYDGFGDRPMRNRAREQLAEGHPFSMEVLDDSANPVFSRQLLTKDEIAAGWIALFDGETLFGWQTSNPEVNWKVIDGAITADPGPEGFLHTSVPFADYELIVEFRASPDANSGVMVRSTTNPIDPINNCVEVNIAPAHPEGYTTGSLVGRALPEYKLENHDGWQTLRMIVQHNTYIVELNSNLVAEYQETEGRDRPAGYICLQQRFGKVEFRKVNLKPLAMRSMFNSTSLANWSPVPGSKAEFTIEQDSWSHRRPGGTLCFRLRCRLLSRRRTADFSSERRRGLKKPPPMAMKSRFTTAFRAGTGTHRRMPGVERSFGASMPAESWQTIWIGSQSRLLLMI